MGTLLSVDVPLLYRLNFTVFRKNITSKRSIILVKLSVDYFFYVYFQEKCFILAMAIKSLAAEVVPYFQQFFRATFFNRNLFTKLPKCKFLRYGTSSRYEIPYIVYDKVIIPIIKKNHRLTLPLFPFYSAENVWN